MYFESYLSFPNIRFANSLGRELTEVDNEITEKLGRSIISPYIRHLTSLGDKVKSSLLRDVHSLAMVRSIIFIILIGLYQSSFPPVLRDNLKFLHFW